MEVGRAAGSSRSEITALLDLTPTFLPFKLVGSRVALGRADPVHFAPAGGLDDSVLV